MTSHPTGVQSPFFTNEGLDFRSRWGAVPKSDSVSLASSTERAPKNYTLVTKCLAEFVGDFTFVFVGTMQAFVTQGAADNILHAAFAHGLTIFILVASLGHISGGHFNPVVSWAVALNRKMPYYHFPFYMMSQLLGGIAGAFMTAVLNNHDEGNQATIRVYYKISQRNGHIVGDLNDVINRTIKAVMSKGEFQSSLGGATLLSADNHWWQGFISETVVSYFLVHTILLTAVDTDKNALAPLAIGMTLTIDILATGKITGASMNPARSLGPNIVGSIFLDTVNKPTDLWQHHYIYWAGPFLGSTIAALWFRLFESREERFIK